MNKQQDTNDIQQPTVALLLCGNPFEDFFDTIGVFFEDFRTKFRGSYQFGYVDALRLAGVRTVLFYISARVSKPLRFKHEPSGAEVCILPAPSMHRAFRQLCRLPLFSKRQMAKSLDSYLLLPLRVLTRELRREGCSAVLFQDYENPSFDVCVLLGKIIHLPVFATFQGATGPRSRLERPIRPLALQGCAGLIIASQLEMQRVKTQYKVSPTKLARIFNPVDVVSWRAIDRDVARAKLRIPINARVVVFHGRISISHKGLDVLLEAWVKICEERPEKDLRLLLIGTGSDAEELQQRITAMQLRGVMWINQFINDPSLIQEYLSSADVYTLPSRDEGFPVAPIEAMACGLPVVATDVPGTREILEFGEESGGLIVPREDPLALATALGQFIDDEAWANELGRRARIRSEECFSLEVIGRQLSDVLLIKEALGCKNEEQDKATMCTKHLST